MANSVFLGQGDVSGPASATDGALCAFDGTTGKLIKVGSASGVFVSSITGTANQVIASAATGAVTLSLPQSIGTGSSPTFAGVTSNVVLLGNGTAANPALAFTSDAGTPIGWYRRTANEWNWSYGGVERYRIGVNFEFGGPLNVGNTTVGFSTGLGATPDVTLSRTAASSLQLLGAAGADVATFAASAYKVGATAGVSFSGAVTNITVVNGIVTAAS